VRQLPALACGLLAAHLINAAVVAHIADLLRARPARA
jgi:hypothetical protein